MTLEKIRYGTLTSFLDRTPAFDIGASRGTASLPADESQGLVFAGYRLQDVEDYRAALQTWFAAVRPGGVLVVVVPHAFLYERQATLPSRWGPEQRRLYTPAALLEEVEEALAPNSYRVRQLCDADSGYDYALAPTHFPVGQHDILLVLEKIVPPGWSVLGGSAVRSDGPAYAFEPPRTRREVLRTEGVPRILVLKLDHLGDFVMALPALQRLRAAFPEAEITLVVGSWNRALAEEHGLADRVIAFDGFPRNASEQKDDIRGTVSAFEARIAGEYDLAIDLRTDTDTRVLLQSARARIRAAIGSPDRFDFLDIFLPIDASRETEGAWSRDIPARDFAAQPYCRQGRFHIAYHAQSIEVDRGAILWGPYHHLPAGRYRFEPFLEFDWAEPGLVKYDICLDAVPVVEGTLASGQIPPLGFAVARAGARFEFRLWGDREGPVPAFGFHGGHLARRGAASVLHQSEYLLLLVELVVLRVGRHGLLREWQA